MEAEREALVKLAFPELRRRCEARGIVWSDVDLRWGVTAEDAAERRVVRVCLDEVERCRPFFIGLLGDRYGSVLQLDADLYGRFPWLSRFADRSVTELEIRHGVLNADTTDRVAFFYSRDQPGSADETADARAKLHALRQEIEAVAPVRRYRHADELASLVVADLAATIERRFPAPLDPATAAAAPHMAFGTVLSSTHVERPGPIAELDRHARGDDRPLVIVGPPGSGKSSLMARWAQHEQGQFGLRLVYFAEAREEMTDWTGVLHAWLRQLRRYRGGAEDVPESPEALTEAFEAALSEACVRAPVLVALDGIDRLTDAVSGVAWLPSCWPRGACVLLSTRSGATADALRRRGWPTLSLGTLSPAEIETLATAHLARAGKRLPAPLLSLIGQSPNCGNARFLGVVLDELRMFGDHERLAAMLQESLAATDSRALLGRVLDRLQKTVDDPPGLLADALGLLGAARGGLSSTELRDLLGSAGRALPQIFLSPLRVALGERLIDDGGLLRLLDEELRTEVETRFGTERRAFHRRLAAYFRGRTGRRHIQEFPWQLACAGEWTGLGHWLSDPEVVAAAWRLDQDAVAGYWRALEQRGGRPQTTYAQVVHAPLVYRGAREIASLLRHLGHFDEAASILSALSATSGEAAVRLELAGVQRGQGRLAAARSTLRALIGGAPREGSRALLDAFHLLAVVETDGGDYPAALEANREEERLAEELGDAWSAETSRFNQAKVLFATGRLDEASRLFSRYEDWARRRGDPRALEVALGGHAMALLRRGRRKDAMERLRQAEGLCRSWGDAAALVGCLGRLAEALMETGDFDEADTRVSEAEGVARQLGRPGPQIDALLQRARLSLRVGFPGEARRAAEQAHSAARRAGLGERAAAAGRLLAELGRMGFGAPSGG
jgi:tetratricopeptide (TPR) repeat protein